jgi:hypothetical protein
LFPITYAVQFFRAGVATTDSAVVMNFIAGNNTFSLNTWSNLDLGLYSINVTAEIPQVLLPGGKLKIWFSFDIDIVSDCPLSVISD